jgi:2-phospho-L-lactate/phosphoenolpyruvate guanylyltransferase
VRTAAVLPVKRFARAKQRLGVSVADALRLALADAMVADVLAALAQTDAIEQTIVVTGEQAVTATAQRQGAIVVPDADEAGQSAAATLGVRCALERGIERVLCVPGDCPALDPAELDALLGAHAGEHHPPAVLIVPDRHGSGTNGLLLAPPDAIPPSFGPDSCARHRALAHASGVACRVESVPSLLLDIDTRPDLDALRSRLAGHSTGALRTRAVLGAPDRTHVRSVETPV